MVLYARLKFILDFANSNTTRATNLVLSVLDDNDQQRILGRLLLQSDDMSSDQWYNQFLKVHGPSMSSIIKQIIEPRPFADETMEMFIQRLSLNSLRVPVHPCEQLGISKFLAVLSSMPEFSPLTVNSPLTWKRCLTESLAICTQYRTATGSDLKHPSYKRPTAPLPSQSLRPQNNSQRQNPLICSHCNKRRHNESTCWDKYPTLKP